MTALFVLSLAFIFYVAIGYPLLLALLPARRRRNEPEPHADRTVSIILPVRNGSKWLRPKLESILALDYPRHLLQILVVSDGSTDDTDSIAAEYPGIELLRIPPSGKAGALNAGLAHATGELLFFTDVRQQLDPHSFEDCGGHRDQTWLAHLPALAALARSSCSKRSCSNRVSRFTGAAAGGAAAAGAGAAAAAGAAGGGGAFGLGGGGGSIRRTPPWPML